MIKSINQLQTYNADGAIAVNVAVDIVDVNIRYNSTITDIIDNLDYLGTIELQVRYLEIDENDNAVDIGSGRNDLETRIVRPLEVYEAYLLTLDQNLFNNLLGGIRLFTRANYFLRKHCIDTSLFAITDINQWEIII